MLFAAGNKSYCHSHVMRKQQKELCQWINIVVLLLCKCNKITGNYELPALILHKVSIIVQVLLQ